MRRALLAAAVALSIFQTQSIASPFLTEGENVLAPMAHVAFCVRYLEDCRPGVGEAPLLTPGRLKELAATNAAVNRAIVPEANTGGLATERWLIWPARGECHDYAVTKRHELLQRGWPASVLLLAEVVVHSGEHHLVLVVRTVQGDRVLDNLRTNVTPWERLPYRWIKIQSPLNPNLWRRVSNLAPEQSGAFHWNHCESSRLG
jgi:predicted transglutaminase-like cysteine proteinase